MKNKTFYKSGKFKNDFLENFFFSSHNSNKNLLLFSRNDYTYKIKIPIKIYKKFWKFNRSKWIYDFIGLKKTVKMETIAKITEYKN